MKRYDEVLYVGHYSCMNPRDDGDWVRYEDVQDLQRQLDEERARLDWLIGFSMHCGPTKQWEDADGRCKLGEAGDTAREAIDRERKGEKA